MNRLPCVLLTSLFLVFPSGAGSFSQEEFRVVAVDDCGNDGRQRHMVSGLNWTFTEEEIPVAAVPKDSPIRSVSFGGVLYRYRGLKSEARYQVRATYVCDRAVREQVCMIDGRPAGDTIRMVPSQPIIRVYDVPREASADGQIDVTFKLLRGPNDVVSFLELLSNEPALLPVVHLALRTDFNGTLNGRVVDENSGDPLKGARVTAVAGDLPPLRAATSAAGEFSLRTPHSWKASGLETYQVEVMAGGVKERKQLPLFELHPERNPLAALPDSVSGVKQCRMNLNGRWLFALKPAGEFWKVQNAQDGWSSIDVPGECRMQGFPVEHDREYAYRRTVAIPADFRNNRVLIRFHGVYSYARVWVNGRFVRSHHGGFTSWDCDITGFVTPGEEAVLTVGVTDRADEISFGSGYAKHPIGGILRSVELMAVPRTFVRKLYIETDLDSMYRDAHLRIDAALSSPIKGEIRLRLFDPDGAQVEIAPSTLSFSRKAASASASIPVRSPQLWDAEHPRLYTLEARFVSDNRVQEVVRHRIGFREVAVQGRALLVNGKPVKLRGACRHDIHPTQGRSTTPEQDREDVLLAKEANFNFIRTSHYPPSKEFLDACDEIGIYVEEETAICFVSTFRGGVYKELGGSHSDERFTERYLSQLAEMIDRDRNRPGVIIWSIGNENTYGTNFQKEYAYVKAVDLTRPVMFSFPHTVPKGVTVYDIYSTHYPSFDRCLKLDEADRRITVPNLGDEWMHVACYCMQDLRTDPNIRNFWGESIKRAWENNFECEESIGGAIWGMIDETFLLPDSVDGYGQWGILDVWRRKKPEFWHTRKGYSPVRLLSTTIEGEAAGRALDLPVHNRFDHTGLQEVVVRCSSGTVVEEFKGPAVPPHGRGTLRLPGSLNQGQPIHVEFVDGYGRVIDEELLTPPSNRTNAKEIDAEDGPTGQGNSQLTVEVSKDSIVASTGEFSIAFDARNGLIRSSRFGGMSIIEGGPYLHLNVPVREITWDVDSLVDVGAGHWHCESLAYEVTDTSLLLSLRGKVDTFSVAYTIAVFGSGKVVTSYRLDNPPGECQEMGIRYQLSRTMDRLSWDRRALWSTYPGDHIGRPRGEAARLPGGSSGERYRGRPDRPWSEDTRDFFLFKGSEGVLPEGLPVSNDFRSTKENITSYRLWDGAANVGLHVEADGDLAARTGVPQNGPLDLFLNRHWTYMNLEWGNYERPASTADLSNGSVKVRFFRMDASRSSHD